MKVEYVHLTSRALLPDLSSLKPFKAVVIIDDEVPVERRVEISEWLVESGCLYMMAWGDQCSRWDDSVDMADLQAFDYGEILKDKFVMTTWHDDEPLKEVFWFAKHAAHHATVIMEYCVLLHLAEVSSDSELMSLFEAA
jgi:hypothetical protein